MSAGNQRSSNQARTAFTGVTIATKAANFTLTANDNEFQEITLTGAGRDCTLPAYADSVARKFSIKNVSASALDITVKDAAAATVGVIGQNETGVLCCNGTAWTISVTPSGGSGDAYALLGGTQTFTGVNTMSAANVITHANTGLKVLDSGGDHATTIVQNSNEAANRTLNIPALGGNDTLATLGAANTFTATNTFSGACTVSTADLLTNGGVIVPTVEPVRFTIFPHATQTTYTLLNNRAVGWTVVGITVVPDLAQGGALTATIVKATANAAPSAGTTPMHAANAIDCNATANTSQVITLTATGADLVLAATDKIGIVFSAALTTGILSGTIWMKRS